MSKKSEKEIQYVNSSGNRLDGRKVDELRKIKIKAGVIPSVDGSAYLEWGQNKVLVSVNGPRQCVPKHEANPYKAVLRYQYRMVPFSVTERKNPRPNRRDIEISKVSGEALEKALMLEKYPNTAIDVFAIIMDSNAGTRVAALTAAAVALADAGIPMKDLVTGITAGRAGGHAILDLNKAEEDAPDAVDIAMAYHPNSEELVLLQMDGEISKEEWKKISQLSIHGMKKVYEIQKQALKDAYNGREERSENFEKEMKEQ